MDQLTVRALFDYRGGALYWKNTRADNAKLGSRAGTKTVLGYRQVKINNKAYAEHRVIFLWHHGFLPEFIDHINRVRDDNRIQNLRPATNASNQINAPKRVPGSGIRGVKRVSSDRWVARASMNGKEIYLGTYKTARQAQDAYLRKVDELHPGFSPLHST